VPIYDGHRLRHGNEVPGPAVIEEATTAIFIDAPFDCVTDAHGSFALYRKERADLVAGLLAGGQS
jgi:N-methylhydantoinase A